MVRSVEEWELSRKAEDSGKCARLSRLEPSEVVAAALTVVVAPNQPMIIAGLAS
jgi:hypothetical protein